MDLGQKMKHDAPPMITDEMFNMSSSQVVDIGGVHPSFPLIKAHGEQDF
jgi:hypothetical protein